MTFSFDVIDPCSETFFDFVTPPVSNMLFTFGSSSMSQATNVITQLFLNNGILCPTTLSLTPTSGFVSLTSSTITVDGSSITPSDFGIHPFTLTARLT